jgi:hypothetical protein
VGLATTLASAPLLAQGSAAEPGLKFSGVQRTRYERLDPQFRAGIGDDDTALALQTSLNFDWRGERVRVFGEILDSRVELNDASSFLSTSNVDALEPVQAYVEWRPASAQTNAGSTLRAGRMTVDLGKRRVLARSRYRNTVDTFLGVDWQWHGSDGRVARVFAARPFSILPDDAPSLLDNDFELNELTPHATLLAFYHQWAPLKDRSIVEVYLLDYERRPSGVGFDPRNAADHTSLGARMYRPASAGEWNYEVEAVVQRGHSGGATRTDLRHDASVFHAEVGYQFDSPWSPNVVLQFDDASGDRDPNDLRNERFDTLFGDRSFDFGPTGLLGIAARANLESPGVRATMRPRPKWRCTLAYRQLELDEARDTWVGSGWRDATGAAGDSIGRYLEASAARTAIEDRLTVETGFVRLAAGSFATRTAGTAFHGDPQYLYFTATTSF